jgi:hypothetical protein
MSGFRFMDIKSRVLSFLYNTGGRKANLKISSNKLKRVILFFTFPRERPEKTKVFSGWNEQS